MCGESVNTQLEGVPIFYSYNNFYSADYVHDTERVIVKHDTILLIHW